MRTLLIASRNAGKVEEIQMALAGLPFELKTLADTDAGEVEEIGETFEQNAVLKARTYGDWTHMLTIADDSGLEVDALDGGPGVKSARYADGSDEDRCRELLRELEGVPQERRGARFVAVIALYDPSSGVVRVCEGEAQGRITTELLGSQGFGYDPVFFYIDAGKSGGEMSREEKGAVSHRGRALAKMRELLRKGSV